MHLLEQNAQKKEEKFVELALVIYIQHIKTRRMSKKVNVKLYKIQNHLIINQFQ
jgi:hypothetical protein